LAAAQTALVHSRAGHEAQTALFAAAQTALVLELVMRFAKMAPVRDGVPAVEARLVEMRL